MVLPPAICFLLGCGGGTATPAGPLKLEVVGSNYNWYIRYPGPDNVLHSDDDVVAVQHMHVPAHTRLHIEVTSKDYLYTFRVPDLDQLQMAVPDLIFALDFDSGATASHVLKGDQMCGFAHESLIGKFTVDEPATYRTWLAEQAKAGNQVPAGRK